jgi:Fur family ferric uptake transcriptional regulator
MVHQIDDGTGIAKFAISEGNCLTEKGKDLHLHFHCIECNRTFCLQDRMTDACLPTDYETKEVNLVLKGICKNCIMS